MSPRGLTIALIVSLAVNLFVLGAVAGGFFIAHRLHQAAPTMRSGGPPLWRAGDALPPLHRSQFRTVLRGQAAQARAHMLEAREARAAAWRRLGDDPLDAASVEGDLDRARAVEMQARTAVERQVVRFAAELPPAERRRLAEGLARSAPGPGGPMRGMRTPHGPPPPDGP